MKTTLELSCAIATVLNNINPAKTKKQIVTRMITSFLRLSKKYKPPEDTTVNVAILMLDYHFEIRSQVFYRNSKIYVCIGYILVRIW